MPRIEKSVFISYRRTNAPWALNVYQYLTTHGYDVFLDYEGVGPGDFESIIVDNITSRAHFLVILTPSALERCGEPGDWLRREIETALETKRNIVPLMLEGFSFGTPTIASQLTGKLATLKAYNGLTLPIEYFLAAMEKLQRQFLSVPLAAVLHPATKLAQQTATEQRALADAVPAVLEDELTAQQYFERGVASSDLDEEIYFHTEAIRLHPRLAEAYFMRGVAYEFKGDLDAAIQDFNQTIKLLPNFYMAYYDRGTAHAAKGDLDAAFRDFNQAIKLQPDFAEAYYNRAQILESTQQPALALADYQKYLNLGGGENSGDTTEVEAVIRSLQEKP